MAAAVVVPELVQGFVLLIGMGIQVAEVEGAVAKTLREVHHPGMDQAMVQEGAEALGPATGVAPDTDQGVEVGTEAGVVVAKELGEEGAEALGPAAGVALDADQGAEAGVEVAKEVGEEEEVEAMAVKLVQDPDPDERKWIGIWVRKRRRRGGFTLKLKK